MCQFQETILKKSNRFLDKRIQQYSQQSTDRGRLLERKLPRIVMESAPQRILWKKVKTLQLQPQTEPPMLMIPQPVEPEPPMPTIPQPVEPEPLVPMIPLSVEPEPPMPMIPQPVEPEPPISMIPQAVEPEPSVPTTPQRVELLQPPSLSEDKASEMASRSKSFTCSLLKRTLF
ncbi:cell division protein ZipA-like isoform X1 [Periplaneta americana]|uniref:cell division protein ZipA-like isoform X1 n=1 Tax=Periplaneta americana TaxID=6978 RepID=UPI0037E8C5A3